MPAKRTASVLFLLSLYTTNVTAFHSSKPFGVSVEALHSSASSSSSSSSSLYAVAAPPDQDIMTPTKTDEYYDEALGGSAYDDDVEDMRKHGPLEWLEDDMDQSREDHDPFHLILLGETFDKPKITVPYVVGSLQYVLEMPYDEANEATVFAKDEGMSCLGTWKRQECLKLGRQLRLRDLLVRVVPYSAGGQRGWQARGSSGGEFAGAGSSSRSIENSSSFSSDSGSFIGFD